MNNKPKSECSACKKNRYRRYYPVLGLAFLLIGILIYEIGKLIINTVAYFTH